jgi:plastocyanin
MPGITLGGSACAVSSRVSRRNLIRTGTAGVATYALATTAGVIDPEHLLGQEASPEPQLREYVLTASEFDWELMPGETVRAWGYNGQLPGPEIRVREGDTLRVILKNDLPVPTTVHWHGVVLPPNMDGPAGLNQAPVAPGDTFVYEFEAKPAGTRWYHSHADPAVQVPLGLHGPLVIEPRSAKTTYDREYTLVLGEWDMELTPGVAAGTEPRGPRDQTLRGGELGADMFLINGKMHGYVDPIRIAEGERILVRLINAGHMAHPIHTHGHSFTIVATDGNPIPEAARWLKDTILVAPGERYDLELLGDNPGVWMVHCHIEHHMENGMMTTIWYDGHVPSGPAGAMTSPATPSTEHHHHGDSGTPATTPTTAVSPAADGSAEIAMVDDRFVPNALTVPVGTTVTWINKGSNQHSIQAFDGSFESAQLSPGDRFEHTFDAPGTFQYICKHHAMHGMIGSVTVRQP